MKERPILFSGEMVRAILDGRKTQTRRVVKFAPPADASQAEGWEWELLSFDGEAARFRDCIGPFVSIRCPYGLPGDRLWVRETFSYITMAENERWDRRRADGVPVHMLYRAHAELEGWADQVDWTPSIFMPRWASRIDLEVTSVRVERLQAISEEDAKAEGMPDYEMIPAPAGGIGYPEMLKVARLPVGQFARAWNSLNAKRGYSWDSNPWVWVVEFKHAVNA